MPSLTVHGLTFDTSDYGSGIITQPNLSALNSAIWNYSTITTLIAGSGIDIQVCITNRTSGIQRAEHNFQLKNGFTTGIFPRENVHYWMADNIVKRWPQASGESSSAFWGRNVQYPNTAFVPFMGCDDGTKISTISWNYQMPMAFNGNFASVSSYVLNIAADRSPSFDQINGRAPVDWYASGETRCFNIYIRVATGITNASLINTLTPYSAWYQTLFPFNHPPAITGRIYQILYSQTEVPNPTGINSRRYHSFHPRSKLTKLEADRFTIPYVHPDSASGFAQLLAASVPSTLLLQNNYNGIMAFTLTGVSGGGEDFYPSVISNLPTALYNTLPQISSWTNRHDLKVYVWAGQALTFYQSGVWNSSVISPLASGKYNLVGGVFNLSNSVCGKWKVHPSGHEQFVRNFHSGIFLYTDGAGMDAAPFVSADPWVTGYYAEFRSLFPTKNFALETVHEDISVNYAPSVYYPHTEFKGRCVFLDTVTPGYQPWVPINYFTDFYNPIVNLGTGTAEDAHTACLARVEEIESQGALALIGYNNNDVVVPNSGLLPVDFKYFDNMNFTNRSDDVGCGITHMPGSNDVFFASVTGYSFNKWDLHGFLDKVWNSGYTACLLDYEGALGNLDSRTNVDYVIDRWLDAAASSYLDAKTYRPDLEIGFYYYPCLKDVTNVYNYNSSPSTPAYISGYNAWVSGIQRMNYRVSGASVIWNPWYQYTDFLMPDLYDFFGSEQDNPGSLEYYRRWAHDNIAINNRYLSGSGAIPMYPIIWMYFHDVEAWAGKPWERGRMQYAIDVANSGADGLVLYGYAPSYSGLYYIYQPSIVNVANWQVVNSGALAFRVAGKIFDVYNMNFTSVTDYDDIAAVLQSGISNAMNNLVVTTGHSPTPYYLGSMIVGWDSGSNYFTLQVSPSYAAYGTEAPFDSYLSRTAMNIGPVSPLHGNTDLFTATYLGSYIGNSVTYRDPDEWTRWAVPSEWWQTFFENACGTSADADFFVCSSMWPETMWPDNFSMWPEDMWPYCYSFLLFGWCGCIIETDLISKEVIDTDLNRLCVVSTNLLVNESILTNLLQTEILPIDLLRTSTLATDLTHTCVIITDIVQQYIISNANLVYTGTLITDLERNFTVLTDLERVCTVLTDISKTYTIPLNLCIINEVMVLNGPTNEGGTGTIIVTPPITGDIA